MNVNRPNFRLVVTKKSETIIEGKEMSGVELGVPGVRRGLRLPVVPRAALIREASGRAEADAQKLSEKIEQDADQTKAEYQVEEEAVQEEEAQEKKEDISSPDLGRQIIGKGSYREFAFPEKKGRYVYRQYDDGSILIIEAPAHGPYEKGSEPTLITKESNPKAWRAISMAIQAQRDGKRVDTVRAFAQTAAALSMIIVAAAVPPPPRHKRKKRKPEPDVPPAQDIEEPGGFPWMPVGIAAAVLVGIIAVVRGGPA